MGKPEHDRTVDDIEFGATDLEATKRFPGGRRCHFLDPNANELAVCGARMTES